MNRLLEYFTGMGDLTDEVIAMDFLNTAKSGVRSYAMAVTECGTPEIKAILTKQLDQAIDSHERILQYVMAKGLYHPYNMKDQVTLDLNNIQTALSIPH